MKRLSNKKTAALVAEMERAAAGGPRMWDAWCERAGSGAAVVEFSGGELTNRAIAGFVWAWNRRGRIHDTKIEKRDRFSANGLEGKIMVSTTLNVALMVWRDLPRYRCQVRRDGDGR